LIRPPSIGSAWKSELFQALEKDYKNNQRRSKDSLTFRLTPLRDAFSLQGRWWAGISPLVFHRGGRPIVDFRKRWAKTCEAATMPGLIFHDLRRSAVRNLVSAGVDQTVAMRITGHRTVSIFQRYRIVSDDDVRGALERTEAAQ
jgi:integrase